MYEARLCTVLPVHTAALTPLDPTMVFPSPLIPAANPYVSPASSGKACTCPEGPRRNTVEADPFSSLPATIDPSPVIAHALADVYGAGAAKRSRPPPSAHRIPRVFGDPWNSPPIKSPA